MEEFLFLAPADLREAVLATGAYARALELYPHAKARIACSPEAAGPFRAAPRLAGLSIWTHRPGAWLGVWRQCAGRSYRAAVDLRGAPFLCAALGAERIASPQRRGARGSRLEQWSEALGADHPARARLWPDADASKRVSSLFSGAPVIALAPGASDPRGAWPAERFAAVARRLATGALPGARVALVGDARARADARTIALRLDADGVPAQDLTGRLDMASVAALAAGSALCLGGDGAFTHAAAAAGAPTLALYGLTDERVLGPSGARARTLRGRPFEEVLARSVSEPRGSLLDDVSIDAVEAAALDLLRAGGL
jgi:ADP-heptose:LPS heptosyltransferase